MSGRSAGDIVSNCKSQVFVKLLAFSFSVHRFEDPKRMNRLDLGILKEMEFGV